MAIKRARARWFKVVVDTNADYDRRIASIKTAYNKPYWAGKFYSSKPDGFQDDRANALAIISGLADADKSKSVVENVLISNLYCSPHFE